MKEQIGSLRVKIPEGVPCAPERVLLVHPLAFLFVLLKVEFRNFPIRDESKDVPSIGDRAYGETPVPRHSRLGIIGHIPWCSKAIPNLSW